MSLKTRLQKDMQSALRSGDKVRLGTLRLALASIQRREVDTRRPLDERGTQAVLERLIKQSEEAAAQYTRGGREDLVAKENAEAQVLKAYLPEPLDEAAVERLIAEAIESTGATSPKDMGRVMQQIKTRAGGRVDLARVSARVRTLLSAE
jgi:uncharacterized protein YqeY